MIAAATKIPKAKKNTILHSSIPGFAPRIQPVRVGDITPGTVPATLAIPNRTPAYSGKISMWFTIYPAALKPESPTERVMKATASGTLSVKPQRTRKVPEPRQQVIWKIFLTVVVLK